ncbi:hypothetical protein [Gloeocapsa sp. PCC 73106]|uniref:hypothetical protein n=1 Tax=Gloeocapsa sp. PCC 73106 TaxID=102232 RepID=UPI0002AD1A16|nr:hypothetical protein [Gloeocapsa sp. PCC 73106]ELR99614.1 hypothetical protein GLO73106DRAFT_00034660 [Gloeocapsa sp. PCC 73106]
MKLHFSDSITPDNQWQYLEQRSHLWRKQLYLKGRRLKAFDVWMDIIVNKMTVEEAVENWDLPAEAIRECIQYCETHQELLQQEAAQEKVYLKERGILLEPKITH